MAFQVQELAYELIEALQPLEKRIKARDRALADQLMRAASSVALNIGGGTIRTPAIGGRGSSRRRVARGKRARRCAWRQVASIVP